MRIFENKFHHELFFCLLLSFLSQQKPFYHGKNEKRNCFILSMVANKYYISVNTPGFDRLPFPGRSLPYHQAGPVEWAGDKIYCQWYALSLQAYDLHK